MNKVYIEEPKRQSNFFMPLHIIVIFKKNDKEFARFIKMVREQKGDDCFDIEGMDDFGIKHKGKFRLNNYTIDELLKFDISEKDLILEFVEVENDK